MRYSVRISNFLNTNRRIIIITEHTEHKSRILYENRTYRTRIKEFPVKNEQTEQIF